MHLKRYDRSIDSINSAVQTAENLQELYEADTDRHCSNFLVGWRATLRLKFPFPRTRPATSSLFFSARRVALIPAATECDSQLSHTPEATKGKHIEGASS